MNNIKSQAAELLTFAQLLANKLDTNPAFDQCSNCLQIDPLVRHKAAVECEKNITPFGLIDEYAISGQAVQDAVKEYLGEDIMEMVRPMQDLLTKLSGYASSQSENTKELTAILAESTLQDIMMPTFDGYSRSQPSQWTVFRHLKDVCEYLTSNKQYCAITDDIRLAEGKALRRKFKRSKFFTKDKESGNYTMKDDGIETFFGGVSNPVLSQFVGTDEQVTAVTAQPDGEGSYGVYITFRSGYHYRLSSECTLADVAAKLVENVARHYEYVLEQAQENAEKGMPVTSGWYPVSDEHKLAILKHMNFECPEELQYQVYWRTNGSRWSAYQTFPAGSEEEGYEPICEPTTYTLATELAKAKDDQRKIAEEIEYAEEAVTKTSRKLLDLQRELAELKVKKFDTDTDINKTIHDIAQ